MFTPKVKLHIQFFDRNVIKTRWPKFNKDPLQKAGNLVRKIARGSIKRRRTLRGKPSMPGTPPFSRQGGATPPFKMIFSVPNFVGTSVVVGMVGFGAANPAPGLHEHGGMAARRVRILTKGRRSKRTGKFLQNRTSFSRRMVKYPKRPFMWPALKKARQILPSMWLNSISRG